MKKVLVLAVTVWAVSIGMAQTAVTIWQAGITREDGNVIHFTFELHSNASKKIIYILNGKEKLKVDSIRFTKDSVFIQMPFFESRFRAAVTGTQHWQGEWIKGTSGDDIVLPFEATVQTAQNAMKLKPLADISGRWAVRFTETDGSQSPAIAELEQHGNQLYGSFLTPWGDYRYLTGFVNGAALELSAFDGSHLFHFLATIHSDSSITEGKFISGAHSFEQWTAVRNDTATLPDESAMYVKDGEEKLNFRFPDLNKKMVGIQDARFKNKVVIVQLMGSWCPNCMDETAFLSDYYRTHRNKGVEVVALAYEYSSDFNRSKASLLRFVNRFQVQYPVLFTGVAVGDSLRTEKTLPQVTPIKSFPSSIILDKQGRIRKIDTGFNGPGTGVHYIQYKKEFEETINRLLKE
ncbi:MAG: TlpA family protein disulfide reductase [Bacteroidota bacterium]|nr:TlpA family protein disulfide reductase [Bacteroidota bacterium]